jgi:YD repeat-containing protein
MNVLSLSARRVVVSAYFVFPNIYSLVLRFLGVTMESSLNSFLDKKTKHSRVDRLNLTVQGLMPDIITMLHIVWSRGVIGVINYNRKVTYLALQSKARQLSIIVIMWMSLLGTVNATTTIATIIPSPYVGASGAYCGYGPKPIAGYNYAPLGGFSSCYASGYGSPDDQACEVITGMHANSYNGECTFTAAQCTSLGYTSGCANGIAIGSGSTVLTNPQTCPSGWELSGSTCILNALANPSIACPVGFNPSSDRNSCTLAANNPDPAKNEGKPDCGLGNPCNAGTGNKYQREVDYVGLGTYPLILERMYNSGGATPSAVLNTVRGSQWRSTYDRSIALNSNTVITTATVQREGGQRYYFNLINGAWVGDADVVGTLVQLANGSGWTYTNENDEVETYNAAGQTVSITNRAGLTQTLIYSDGTAGTNGGYVLTAAGVATTTVLPVGKLIRVSDPASHTLQFGYDGTGRVVKMTDPIGGAYLYAYSGTLITDNLSFVTYPDGKTRTYLYGETANVSATPNAGVSYVHSLTGILDENGNRYASWTYDANGLAISSEHGAFGSGVDKVSLSYGTPDASGNRATTVTDPRGVVRSYGFSTLLSVVKNSSISGQPCNGCTVVVTHDANGNVASRTDFNGNTTCYTYDLTRNLETTRVEGLPTGTACPANLATYVPPTTTGSVIRKITTQWHATLRLPTVVAEPLRITSHSYDAKGNPLSKTVQPTSDATGGAGLAAVAAGTARVSSYTYNTAGQVLTVDGPRTDVTDVTHYAYDTQGNLLTVSNALNQVTTLGGYDANGRPGSITDPNGLVTSLTYDARGRLTSRSSGGETTSYTYDGAGNMTNVALPSGASYTYTYDAAHRLTQIVDPLGNKLVYTLDVMGNRTNEQLYDSTNTLVQTHSRVFNALNRLNQDIGAVNQTTTYVYDANGNLTSITDPLNRLSTNAYDALNRLITNTDPANGQTSYGYDALNQLVQVSDPRSLVTQYTRDGLGNLNQQTSPDTGVTANTYDAAGNLLTRTDAKGQVASYSYDALNRLTGISYTGGTSPAQTVSYQYDQGTNGIGHLTKIVDATGTTNYGYDHHGRLITETEQAYGATYTTAYAYDAQGRLASITYPSGRTVNYTFDTMGRINQIASTFNSNTQVLASNIIYEPFGGVHSFNYGDGLTAPVQTYTRQRDQDGRIASYTLNGKPMSIGYDAASQISFISDPQNLTNTASYSYDPLSRLSSYIQGTSSQNFGYDMDGNRVSQTIGSTTTTFGYTTGNNRLASIQTGAGSPQAVTQDAIGATTSDPTRQYGYDVRGRLIQTTTAQGVVNYEVNALGLRVRKQVPYASTDTVYHYDSQGHMIGENPNGAAQFALEYIYLGDQPVAVMK